MNLLIFGETRWAYREINWRTRKVKEVALKPGAEVDVTIEAESEATRQKKPSQSELNNSSEKSKAEVSQD